MSQVNLRGLEDTADEFFRPGQWMSLFPQFSPSGEEAYLFFPYPNINAVPAELPDPHFIELMYVFRNWKTTHATERWYMAQLSDFGDGDDEDSAIGIAQDGQYSVYARRIEGGPSTTGGEAAFATSNGIGPMMDARVEVTETDSSSHLLIKATTGDREFMPEGQLEYQIGWQREATDGYWHVRGSMGKMLDDASYKPTRGFMLMTEQQSYFPSDMVVDGYWRYYL